MTRLSCSTAKVRIMCKKVKNRTRSRRRRYTCGPYNIELTVAKRIMSRGVGIMFISIGLHDCSRLATAKCGPYVLQAWWCKHTAMGGLRERWERGLATRRMHKVGFWD